jgi:hypothetical protein
MAQTALAGPCMVCRQLPPVGWADIPDLVPVIRSQKGAPPYIQALVVRWLLENGGAAGPIDVPPVAVIARDLGIARQSASQAWHALQRRRFIAAVSIDDGRGWSRVTVRLPEAQQLSMFAPPGRAQ